MNLNDENGFNGWDALTFNSPDSYYFSFKQRSNKRAATSDLAQVQFALNSALPHVPSYLL